MTAIALAESKKKQKALKAKGGKPKGTDLGAWSKATGLDVNLKSRPPATSGRNSNPS